MEQWSAPQEGIIGDEHKSQSLCILYDMFKKASYRPDLDYWMTLDFVFLKVSFASFMQCCCSHVKILSSVA